MDKREHIWTAMVALLFAALIWFWAEGENREVATVGGVVRFRDAAETGRFRVRIADLEDPSIFRSEVPIEMRVEGPNFALQNLTQHVFQLAVSDPRDGEIRTVELADQLHSLDWVVANGLTVDSCTPERLNILIDEIETREVPISQVVTGVVVDQIAIEPPTTRVTMSMRMWEWVMREHPDGFVFLDLDPARLAALKPGQRLVRDDVRLRIAPDVAGRDTVVFKPTPVTVSLTLERQLGEFEDAVPVKVALPLRDADRYHVTIDREWELIEDVVLSGPADVLARVRNRELKVFAVINLSSDELEQGVTHKRVEWMVPEGLTVRMKSGQQPPEVPLTISRSELEGE
ncbi:MAG: hypothetical protein ACR2GY_10390 [Phycisphaerales bacterium]